MKNKICMYKYSEYGSNDLSGLIQHWFLYDNLVSNILIIDKGFGNL